MDNNNNENYIGPIISYNDICEDKYLISSSNRNKSGIYRWYNLTNNKSYIGSSTNLTMRFNHYLSYTFMQNALLKSNSNIYKALLEDSFVNFRLDILIYCSPEYLTEKEQYYIDLLKPEYNIIKRVNIRAGSICKDHSLLLKV